MLSYLILHCIFTPVHYGVYTLKSLEKPNLLRSFLCLIVGKNCRFFGHFFLLASLVSRLFNKWKHIRGNSTHTHTAILKPNFHFHSNISAKKIYVTNKVFHSFLHTISRAEWEMLKIKNSSYNNMKSLHNGLTWQCEVKNIQVNSMYTCFRLVLLPTNSRWFHKDFSVT